MKNEIQQKFDFDLVEKFLLDTEQVECNVNHYFGPGVYMREMCAPKGSLILGHRHKGESTNILLKGSIVIISEDKSRTELSAPFIYISPPGRKLGLTLTDVVWVNIVATNETDVGEIEKEFFEKTDYWKMKKQTEKITQEHPKKGGL